MNKITRARQPFTLIEICIAMAVFAIGVLAAMSILVPSVRWGADAKIDFTSAEAAMNVVDYLNGGGALLNEDGTTPATNNIFCGRTVPANASGVTSDVLNELTEQARYYPYVAVVTTTAPVRNVLSPEETPVPPSIPLPNGALASNESVPAYICVYRKRADPFASDNNAGTTVYQTISAINKTTVVSVDPENENVFIMQVTLRRQ